MSKQLLTLEITEELAEVIRNHEDVLKALIENREDIIDIYFQ